MRSQTSTEYLIITAIVIILAVIVVGTLGGIPGIGGGINEKSSSLTLTTEQVGVSSYAVSDYNTVLDFRNNHNNRIRVDTISLNNEQCLFFIDEVYTLAPGETKQITCRNVYELEGNTVSWNVEINWTDLLTGAAFSQNNEEAVLSGDVATGYLAELDNHPSYYFENKGCYNMSLDPIPICTCYDLNLTRLNLTSDHEMQNSIDFDRCMDVFGDAGWTSGLGWDPIAYDGSSFSGPTYDGTFNGGSYIIKNLFLDNSTDGEMSLFGETSFSGTVVQNLGLVDVQVTGGDHVGAISSAGSFDTYDNVFVTGAITSTGTNAGSLVGGNYRATITNSYALATVNGNVLVGGLGGYMIGPISNSFFIGTVSGSGNQIGGLTGYSYGDVTNSYAIATISGSSYVGGLVADVGDTITISNSYSESIITGSSNVGGLVGAVSFGTLTLTGSTWQNNTDNATSCVGDGTNPSGCSAN